MHLLGHALKDQMIAEDEGFGRGGVLVGLAIGRL